MQVKERDRKSCLVETTLRQKSFSALVLNSGKSYYKAKRTKPTTIYLSGNHSQKLQRRPSIPKKKTSSTTRLSAKNSEDEPNIIKEHLFVISDDTVQDQDSVHKVQQLVQGYLSHINYTVEKMHNFTDGFTAQYKSRHCVGNLSCSLANFGYTIQRNYFETSHAKESKMQLAQI